MKKLTKIFIIIALTLLAAFVTPFLIKDPGYFLLRIAGYEIEMSFIVALGLLLMAMLVFSLVFYFIRLPQKAARNYSSNRSRKSFAKGLLALSEGKWKQAEKLLLISSKNSPTPELGYMAAARAAIAQNKIEQAFLYLDDAENHTDNPLTVDLTRCELWLKTGENQLAIQLLNRILKSYPTNPRALNLMTQASQNAQQWQALREILPRVEKLNIITSEKVQQLTQHSILQQLSFAETQEQLQATWNSLNKQQKLSYEFIHAYIQTAQKLNMDTQVIKLTENTLNKNFSLELLLLWEKLEGDVQEKIQTAEKWLKKHPNKTSLLNTLARLCLENKRWGKAHTYLQHSLEIEAGTETYKLLARYFDAIGEPENALASYRQAENPQQLLQIESKQITLDEE